MFSNLIAIDVLSMHDLHAVFTALQSVRYPYGLTIPAKSDTGSMTCDVALKQWYWSLWWQPQLFCMQSGATAVSGAGVAAGQAVSLPTLRWQC